MHIFLASGGLHRVILFKIIIYWLLFPRTGPLLEVHITSHITIIFTYKLTAKYIFLWFALRGYQ